MEFTHLRSCLRVIGFAPEDGTLRTWFKNYRHGTYAIRVTVGTSFESTTIDYGPQIIVGRETCLSLRQPESFVTLECVDRLLVQGYEPNSITLEKSFRVGRNDKYLDILVSKDRTAHMMIECKTAGQEYEKELQRLLEKGGQLLSYYLQDRDARILVLYCSQCTNTDIDVTYSAIETGNLSGSNLAAVHDSWDKRPIEHGVFDGAPFQLVESKLRVRDLDQMRPEDGGKIFNAFAEVLRRHVISDKPNAFNKIFNLFICKVQDEEKAEPDQVLEFQWHEGEPPEIAMSRLNDLYRKGLQQYLHMTVADHSLDEVESRLHTLSEDQRSSLRKIFNDLRLYKNTEFAFIEVYDRRTFLQNAEVVKAVVRLLQRKQIRYNRKQPFMGDFFERLLNTSVKQESGQFFTPIPIARFICEALPLEVITRNKIAHGDPQFLPHIIDFAAGSGHFLTEAMERLVPILEQTNVAGLSNTQRGHLKAWRTGYQWAKEFIYGIEKDYRLAKTAKVSCFLNGDGDANIVRGDGLDNFARSEEYRENGGLLSLPPDRAEERQNARFDVVISNPPYSVAQCRLTLKHGAESFELFSDLTNDSKEIECLFAERTEQLLKVGGVAAVIFPSSILSNTGIHQDAREMLLRHFHFRAIVTLANNTFMKTDTNTVILFLSKRDPRDCASIEHHVEQFFELFQDVTIDSVANAVSTYSEFVWGMSGPDYIRNVQLVSPPTDGNGFRASWEDFLARAPVSRTAQGSDMLTLLPIFRAELWRQEKKKLLHFLLAYNQATVLVNSPTEKRDEAAFLGYEFTERKGREGLRFTSGTNRIFTPLYDEDDPNNPEKIATIIRSNFGTGTVSIPESLLNTTSHIPLVDLIAFERAKFDVEVRTKLTPKRKSRIFPNEPVRRLILAVDGETPKVPTASVTPTGRWPVVSQDDQLICGYTDSVERPITDLPLVLFGDHTCCVKYVDFPFVRGADGTKVFKANTQKVLPKYLYHMLLGLRIQHAGKYMRHYRYLCEELVPLPPVEFQERLVHWLDRWQLVQGQRRSRLETLKTTSLELFSGFSKSDHLYRFAEERGERMNPSGDANMDQNYVGLEHIIPNQGRLSGGFGATPESDLLSAKSRFYRGDVLYGRLRPYLNKVWLATFDGICSTELLVLKPNGVPSWSLKYVMLSNDFVQTTKALTDGMNRPRIEAEDVLNILVPDLSQIDLTRIQTTIESLEIKQQREISRLENLSVLRDDYLSNQLQFVKP